MEEKDQDGWTLVTKANKRRARKVLDAKTEQKSTPNDFYAFKKEEAKLERNHFIFVTQMSKKNFFNNLFRIGHIEKKI